MDTSFSQLSSIYFSQSQDKQKQILKQLYSFSPETKVLLATALGFAENPSIFVDKMKHETVDKVYRMRTPNGKVVNQIISNAKKAGVSTSTMMNVEQLAYRGFISLRRKLHAF